MERAQGVSDRVHEFIETAIELARADLSKGRKVPPAAIFICGEDIHISPEVMQLPRPLINAAIGTIAKGTNADYVIVVTEAFVSEVEMQMGRDSKLASMSMEDIEKLANEKGVLPPSEDENSRDALILFVTSSSGESTTYISYINHSPEGAVTTEEPYCISNAGKSIMRSRLAEAVLKANGPTGTVH